jgi:hypothetical protein
MGELPPGLSRRQFLEDVLDAMGDADAIVWTEPGRHRLHGAPDRPALRARREMTPWTR